MEILFAIVYKLSTSLTIPLTLALMIIYVLRKLGRNRQRNHPINVLNAKLRKVHKPMGIILAVLSIFHGIMTGTPALWGIICSVTIILLGLNFIMRRKFKKPNWMKVHRTLSVIMILTLFLHLVEIENLDNEHFEDDYRSTQRAEIGSEND